MTDADRAARDELFARMDSWSRQIVDGDSHPGLLRSQARLLRRLLEAAEAERDKALEQRTEWAQAYESANMTLQDVRAQCATHVAANAELISEGERLRTERDAPRDDPEADATDAAHPAWWRGDDHGCMMATRRIVEILDGRDDGAGVIGYEPLETLRRRILHMQKRLRVSADAIKILNSSLVTVAANRDRALRVVEAVHDKAQEAIDFAHGWIAGLPVMPSFEDKRAAQQALEQATDELHALAAYDAGREGER